MIVTTDKCKHTKIPCKENRMTVMIQNDGKEEVL